jgi:hypothetical protein
MSNVRCLFWFQVLVAILYLGNIRFIQNSDDSSDFEMSFSEYNIILTTCRRVCTVFRFSVTHQFECFCILSVNVGERNNLVPSLLLYLLPHLRCIPPPPPSTHLTFTIITADIYFHTMNIMLLLEYLRLFCLHVLVLMSVFKSYIDMPLTILCNKH